MHAQQHSTFREGVITGALGAVVVALWYLIVDSIGGRPLYTPNVLGKVFFRGELAPGVRHIVPQVVVGYTVLHILIFSLVGIGLTLLVHLATRNIALRMGVWIGLVVAFGWLVGHVYMLEVATGERLSLWAVAGGGLVGVVTMGGYLWRRHPRLSRSFRQAPLGAEVPPPPHPPGGSRAA